MAFDQDGEVHLVAPPFMNLQRQRLTVTLNWRTSGEKLTIFASETESRLEFTYEITGDELVLTSSDGRELRYRRME